MDLSAGRLMADPLRADVIRLLCLACVDLLDVNGAGVSVMTDADGGGMVAASGDLAAHVEEWQFSLGEGPCKDAYRGGRPIMVADIAADGSGDVARWPVFAGLIRQAGIQAIFAFPLLIGSTTVGVLDIFRDRSGLLSGEQIGVASAFADLTGTFLAAALSTVADRAGVEPVYQHEVHQATGMVSSQLGISVVEALVRLRARAFADGRTVSDLAGDVVARRVRFYREDI